MAPNIGRPMHAENRTLFSRINGFVMYHQVIRIELRIGAWHRLLQKDAGVCIVDGVVNLANQWARRQNTFSVNSITRLQGQPFATDHQRAMLQDEWPRSSFATELIKTSVLPR